MTFLLPDGTIAGSPVDLVRPVRPLNESPFFFASNVAEHNAEVAPPSLQTLRRPCDGSIVARVYTQAKREDTLASLRTIIM